MDTNIEHITKPAARHSAEKKKSARSKKNTGAKKTAAVAVFVFAAAFTASIVTLLAAVPKDVIANGVYADNIDLGGMSKEQAAAVIAEHNFFQAENIGVVSGQNTYDIPTSAIALSVNAEETAQKAFEIGKSGNKLSDAKDVLIMRFSNKYTDIVPSFDEAAMDAQLYEFGKQIYGELTEHSVEIGDDAVVVVPGKTGASNDYTQAKKEILNAVSDGKFTGIPITMNKQSPHDVDVESLYNEVFVQPKDAGFKTSEKSASVESHIVGIELDREDAKAKVSSIKEGGDPVRINIIKTMPSVTADMLEDKLFNTTLASFSTKYSASNVNRSSNVALAAERINGTVLAPGDVFSYNDVVGERTIKNGFKMAAVYENGKSVDGVGGGVCQVSTTLYSAVLYADLKIVSRQNHSLTVAYVPLGQDATVVDGSIDFKFSNNTDYPIKIVSSAGKGTVSVSIVGTQRDTERTVKLEHSTLSKTEPTVKEIKTAELPNGQTRTVSKGKTGYVVESTKIVYENGEEVSRTSLGKSTYKMVPTEVEVGTSATAAQQPPQQQQQQQPANNVNSPAESTPPPVMQPKINPAAPQIQQAQQEEATHHDEPAGAEDHNSENTDN